MDQTTPAEKLDQEIEPGAIESSGRSNEYILEMRGISKAFPGVQALDSVDFKLRPGSIHALLGENGAGKSTLMKVLFGIYRKDSGEILINGEPVEFTSSKQALDHGVSMVHQELNQVRSTRIVDNLWLGRFPTKNGFIDEQKMKVDTQEVFDSLDINLDPHTRISDLSVSSAQMVEIAKAVSYNARIIVMDEPTSSLTENEVNHLFRILRRLRENGTAIVYISHKMDEIKQIADEVTIFRDGKYVGTFDAATISIDEIIHQMVGRNLENWFPPKTNHPGEVILEVKDFSSTNPRSFQDVSFDLREGEILGISGLVGSQRTELVESIFGYRTIQNGTLLKNGNSVVNRNPAVAIQNGFSLVTEERRANGIFGVADVTFNSTIAHLKAYLGKFSMLNDKGMREDTQRSVDQLSIKTPSQKTRLSSLSGGNQQKVILGRWLLTSPDILLLDEPTRGIDVGAKYEIYQLMIELANQGKAIIMVSSEMPELLGVTDRILVMSNGRMAGIVDTKETTQEEIMTLAAKYL
jgi:methyl-galactoside transport system ATP-binding protein